MRALPVRSRPSQITALISALMLFTIAAWVITSGSATGHRASQAKPHLVMTEHNPATVHGSGFKPRDRVRVTLTVQKTFVRRPGVSRHGTFTATFPTAVDLCTSWTAYASQRHGASATLHGPKPECAPASTP